MRQFSPLDFPAPEFRLDRGRASDYTTFMTDKTDDPKIEPIDASGKPAGNKQTPRPAPQPGTLEEFMGGQ